MKFKFFIALALVVVTGLAACISLGQAASPESGTLGQIWLKVYAPFSLNAAGTDLSRAFESAHPDVKVAIEFGSTAAQRRQIALGMMGDILITASQQEMQDAIASQAISSQTPAAFACSRLAVVLPASNPAHLNALADLAKPGVRLLLVDPSNPAGQAGLDVLLKMEMQYGAGYRQAVLDNAVSSDGDIQAVISKITLGEADAAILNAAVAAESPLLKMIDIPGALNIKLPMEAALLNNAANPEHAAAFMEFLLSPQGQAILNKWGFFPASQ